MADFNPKKYLQNIGKGNQPRLYLPTEARILWFRHLYPMGLIAVNVDTVNGIVFALVSVDGIEIGSDLATVRDGKGQTWAGRDLEKAATAAVGRALKNAGFGTLAAMHYTGMEGQSGDEDDEQDYLPDAPQSAPAPRQNPPAQQRGQSSQPPAENAQNAPQGDSAWAMTDKTQGQVIYNVNKANGRNAKDILPVVAGMRERGMFEGCASLTDAVDMVVAEMEKPDMNVTF